MRPPGLELEKWVQLVLNNLYEIENKLSHAGDPGNALRNVARMKEALASAQVFAKIIHFAQSFVETRTDLEVTISGTETRTFASGGHKPIIRVGDAKQLAGVVQKGIVVVQGIHIQAASDENLAPPQSAELRAIGQRPIFSGGAEHDTHDQLWY